MSKEVARSPQSYENEALVLSLLPALLEPHSFSAVATTRQGGMKFIARLDELGEPLVHPVRALR